jgi:hypothetical protein
MSLNLLVDSINEFVDFLEEHKITADQFLFCVLLSSEYEEGDYDVPENTEKTIGNFYKYKSLVVEEKDNPVWTQTDIKELVDKGFLEDVNKYPDKFAWDNFRTTEKFISLVFEEKEDEMDLYQEFWDEYPDTYESQEGKVFNIKAVNFETMFGVYKKALKVEDHETIMKSLKLAKQRDEVNCRLDKWLNSRRWEPYVDELENFDPEQTASTSQTLL